MKVRIKKSPSHRTGDQFDYSAVTHPTFPNYFTGGEDVKNTIGGVPREQANIEAEGGETIIGDLNNDGNIEHFTITGKRHSQGGVPMNVPPGSFIFSDTKKMKIKDPEVLEHFGMGNRKGGYTPAEISKRYKLNEFMKTVNSNDADPLAKRTAQDMLEKNMRKLAELAAYQESMKGKQPPTISQQILGEEPEQEMRDGGQVKMQQGGVPPKVGTTFYLNGKPVKISRYVDDSVSDYVLPNFISDPGGVYFKDKDNKEVYLDYKQFKQLRDSGTVNVKGSKSNSFWTGDDSREYMFSTKPGGTAPGLKVGNYTFNIGDKVVTKDGEFKIVDPQAYPNPSAKYSTMMLEGPKGVKKMMQPKDIIDLMNKNMAQLISVSGNNGQNENDDVVNLIDMNNPSGASPQPPVNNSGQQRPAQPVQNNPRPAVKQKKVQEIPSFDTFEEAVRSFMYGGDYDNDMYNFGGYVFDPTTGKMTKMQGGGEREVTIGTQKIAGKTYKVVRRGNDVEFIDPATGAVAQRQDYRQSIDTYDPESIAELEKEGVNLTKAMDIENLAKTPGMQGSRTDNGRVFGRRNWAQGKEYEDFRKRHARFLQANPNFNPAKEEDARAFQQYYNEDIRRQGREAGLPAERIEKYVQRFGFDPSKSSGAPNALDSKFGQYTWSRPTFDIKKLPPEPQPQPDPQPQPEPKPAEEIEGKARREPGGMWLQNKNAIAMAAMEEPFYGPPSMVQVDMVGFDPQLEEYSAKNAMLQSNLASLNNQFAMTGDAATSRAAMLGAVGRANEQGAGIIENIQNRNIGTTNQAARDNAEINNRESLVNAELRKKYIDESNVYGQQLQNFFNTKNTRFGNAVNRGLVEMQNTNMVESMYPQYTIDRNTGAVAYDPSQGLGYNDEVLGAGNSSAYDPATYANATKKYYEAIKSSNPGLKDEVAYEQASKVVQNNYNISSRGQRGVGFMNAVSNMRGAANQPAFALGGPFYYDEYLFEV